MGEGLQENQVGEGREEGMREGIQGKSGKTKDLLRAVWKPNSKRSFRTEIGLPLIELLTKGIL